MCRDGRTTIYADAVIIEAPFYRLRNLSLWRDQPAEFGPPRTIYGWFRKWTACGQWDRLLIAVAKHRSVVRLGVVRLVDGTHIPVHQSGCNPRGGAEHQAMGKTRGGRNSKFIALVDARGRLISCLLGPGQAYDGKYVCPLLPAQGRLIIVGTKAMTMTNCTGGSERTVTAPASRPRRTG